MSPRQPPGIPLVTTRDVVVAYGPLRALDGLDLEIGPGAVGLLGPNGAGKTTLIRVLLGHLAPQAGEARVLGLDPRRGAERLALRQQVGTMPEGECLMPGMNAVELVATLGRISGLRAVDALTRAHEVLDYVGLDEARYREATQYSTGMRQRLKLAQALVHDPGLLLLDEPTSGLDPRGRLQMLELVHDLAHTHGKNVILCSHLLPDVERICREVVVLHRGQVVRAGSVAAMTAGDRHWIRLRAAPSTGPLGPVLEARGLVFEDEGAEALKVRLPEAAEDADLLFDLAREAGVVLTSLQEVRSSLEEVFLRVVADSDSGSG